MTEYRQRLCALPVLYTCLCASLLGQALPQNSPVETKDDRPDSLATIVPSVLADQKAMFWDFPRDLAQGKHWIPTSLFLGATAALIGTDQYSSPYFRRTTSFQTFNSGFSGIDTSFMIAAAPAALYVTGLLRHDSYAKQSAYLTAEAVADSEIVAEVLKLTTRRARPESIQPNRNFADTWLDSRSVAGGGFPSGHSVAAFSVATVLSSRYGKRRKWVPYVSYGAAGLVCFSRLTLSSHNVSDVLVGAALGYAITRFVVLRHHDQSH